MENCFSYQLEFKECMSILKDTSDIVLNRFSIGKFNSQYKLSASLKTILTNAYSVNFSNSGDSTLSTLPFVEWDSDSNEWIFKEVFVAFIDYLFREHGVSYCAVATSDTDSELIKTATLFLDNVLNLCFETFDKYQALYNGYEVERHQLLRAVKSNYSDNGYNATSGSNENSNINKFKDTPQGEYTLEDLGDDYNTNVSINSGKTTNSSRLDVLMYRTAEEERETPIERLNEINQKYLLLYKAWANEFIELFWEV